MAPTPTPILRPSPAHHLLTANVRSKRSTWPTTSTSTSSSYHLLVPHPTQLHIHIAKLSSRFLIHLFACPLLHPDTSTRQIAIPKLQLADFIAHTLSTARLHTSLAFAALYLLQRLKARFPAARGSSGHRLFISAFIIASKVYSDDAYSNKLWSHLTHPLFPLREINQMERDLCARLQWQLLIDPYALQQFERQVRRDFDHQSYLFHAPASSPMPSTIRFTGIVIPRPMSASQTTQNPPLTVSPPSYCAIIPDASDAPQSPELSKPGLTSSPQSILPLTTRGNEDRTPWMIATPSSNIDSISPTANSYMLAPTSSATVVAYAGFAPAVSTEQRCRGIFARAIPYTW
ncbi:hypothetical protein C8Q74DRAFT_1225376 [Fomes fomentarius]|nr:hypothetical protein C8Q74DRAFT_1225376 [Fomes fomentarius]